MLGVVGPGGGGDDVKLLVEIITTWIRSSPSMHLFKRSFSTQLSCKDSVSVLRMSACSPPWTEECWVVTVAGVSRCEIICCEAARCCLKEPSQLVLVCVSFILSVLKFPFFFPAV